MLKHVCWLTPCFIDDGGNRSAPPANAAGLQPAPEQRQNGCAGQGCTDADAASSLLRCTGSNSENSNRPAKKPPICACHATLAPSMPMAIEPTPKTILTPNQTARNARTRRLRSACDSDNAGTLVATSASPRLKDRKLPLTKANRIAAAIVPDTEADAPIMGATACSWVTRCASAPAA